MENVDHWINYGTVGVFSRHTLLTLCFEMIVLEVSFLVGNVYRG